MVLGVNREKREFFGFRAFAVGNVDIDKPKEECDCLLGIVAVVSRRYGLAPVSIVSTMERQLVYEKLVNNWALKLAQPVECLTLTNLSSELPITCSAILTRSQQKDVGLYQG